MPLIFFVNKNTFIMLEKSPTNKMFYKRVTIKQSIYKESFKKESKRHSGFLKKLEMSNLGGHSVCSSHSTST